MVIERPTSPVPLEIGWHPDPYRRWKARYWNGEYWTARVANPDHRGRPVFGTDVIVPAVDPSALASVILALAGTVARLHGEAEKWRAIAEERGRALARNETALPPPHDARPTAPEKSAWYARIYGQ